MFHPQRKYVPQGSVFTGKSPLHSGDIEGNPQYAHVIAPWVSLLRLKLTSWWEISPASLPWWPYWSIFQVTGFRLLEKLDNFFSALRFVMSCVYNFHHLVCTLISYKSRPMSAPEFTRAQLLVTRN